MMVRNYPNFPNSGEITYQKFMFILALGRNLQ